jgi:DNA-binding transcriptional regulator YiaG
VSFSARIPAMVCGACGESVITDHDLERLELHVANWLAGAGLDQGDAFRFMRKALGLRAAELAALLGVRTETVSRWETGALPVERRALALLGTMVADRLEGRDDTITRLEALRAPAKRPRSVRLDVG